MNKEINILDEECAKLESMLKEDTSENVVWNAHLKLALYFLRQAKIELYRCEDKE